MATQTFKAKMDGGPMDGTLYETNVLHAVDLPLLLEDEGGTYRLVSWSKLPPDFDTTHMFRGASYVWMESVTIQDLLALRGDDGLSFFAGPPRTVTREELDAAFKRAQDDAVKRGPRGS